MKRRLFLVIQSICLIPPIIMFPVWLNSSQRESSILFFFFLLTLIPYILIILTKYIIYGKFYIFKIEEEKIVKEKGMSQSEYDSKIEYEKRYRQNLKEKEQYEKKVNEKFHPREIIEENRLRQKEEYYEHIGREILKLEEDKESGLTYDYNNEIVDNSVNNIRKGHVKITLLDGNIFEGECNDGILDSKINGQGTYTSSSGSQYVGEWKNGNMNGQGTYTWSDGDKYVGEFKNGERNGQGTLTYNDGGKEEGKWKEDKMWKGTKYDKDGKILLTKGNET